MFCEQKCLLLLSGVPGGQSCKDVLGSASVGWPCISRMGKKAHGDEVKQQLEACL